MSDTKLQRIELQRLKDLANSTHKYKYRDAYFKLKTKLAKEHKL